MSELRLTRRERHVLERVAAKQRMKQPYITPAAAAAHAAGPGSITIVEVQHDDWCPRLNGGLCRCTPDIVAREVAA